ncbi:hypothetical protein RJT34_31182 [Clitoria ternatea]|uniref:Methyltransferase n=1 Tax=Clitoria ternatea TaxID=43366 RepID=A0AAN9I4R7_CLITE
MGALNEHLVPVIEEDPSEADPHMQNKESSSGAGMTKLKFKPTYNPYTEPSMEIFRGRNSSMFRPEMLKPIGLPEDVQVIAWGLSLERNRPTMILYGIDNMRDLFGHKIWYSNVPHTKLAEYKGHQNWVKVTGEYLTFPGGETQFEHGTLHYIDAYKR